MITKATAEKILVIGPDYKDYKGGIGAVISVYKDQYPVFRFIPSFKYHGSSVVKTFYFIKQFGKIVYYLTVNHPVAIVHIHSSKKGSLYRKLMIACVAKGVFGKKTINHIHAGDFKLFYDSSNGISKKLIRYFLQMHDATLTVSDSWKDYFETTFSLKNVHKINNIINQASGSQPRQMLQEKTTICFLFLGLIDHYKGIFDLVKVMADNKTLLQGKCKLVIAGNGQVALLQALIEKNNIKELVTCTGWVRGPEKEQLLQEAHVFILPSYYEGVPVSILEAMGYGLPVIATAVGGVPEIVQNGVNGMLVPPGNEQALLQALLFYCNHPDLILKQGAASMRLVADYMPGAITAQLETIYRSLL